MEERAKDTADTEREDWTREGRKVGGWKGAMRSQTKASGNFSNGGAQALEFLVTSFFFSLSFQFF